MKLSTKETFKVYLKHALKDKKWYALISPMILLAVIMSLLPPFFYKRFFDLITEANDISAIRLDLIQILIGVFFIYAIMMTAYRLAAYGAINGVPLTMDKLKQHAFAHIHTRSYRFFSDTFTGSLVKKVNRFTAVYNRLFDLFTWDLIPLAIRVVFITIALWFVSPMFGVILFAWSTFFITIVYIVVQYRVKIDLDRYAADSKVTAILADTITNAIPVKLFASRAKELLFFAKVTGEQRRLTKRSWMIDWYLAFAQGVSGIVVEITVMYFAIQLLIAGTITVGDIVLLQAYLLTIGREVWELGHILKRLFESLAEANEMTELLLEPVELLDNKNAKKIKISSGQINFDNINFEYNSTRTILSKFSLNISGGEKIAFVGPSGAGKSTIIKLLVRFFDVSKGKILIDGQDIKMLTQESLHKNIALVPQDPILFHRTLIDNIRYGNPSATDAEAIKAAKLAHAHEFIKDLPEQYKTFVGERGVKLSGGERQRVAIARAILKNAPILVLDEATSSLDSKSEGLIQDALQKLMKGKTTIVVAHRLSTIMAMDRIIVMEKGKIKEQGTHQELLKNKQGLYKKLWELQAGGFLPE